MKQKIEIETDRKKQEQTDRNRQIDIETDRQKQKQIDRKYVDIDWAK